MLSPVATILSAARACHLGAVIGVSAWVLATGVGFRALTEYEMRPGPPALAPDRWPAGTGLSFEHDRSNLVMFAHPQCSCSSASLDELMKIMTLCPGRLHVAVCFLNPDGEADGWNHSALWRDANAIPGVEVVADRNGRLATRFGATTSGQVYLFACDGTRVFSGGITGARGHEGDNRGRRAILALLRGEKSAITTAPVFGCALQDAPASPAGRRQ
ncbi:MAG TPA: hypothetical protein VG710_01250 [Opitutus sp.]|nr:hypothetical protein [Opitutus sp.]